MEHFANRSETDKQAFYAITSDRKNLSEDIIEKDFWVCWTLKHLFSLHDIAENLIFKGGTSLSKVYNLIERFSEDIDISIDKHYLGFHGAQDPENSPSNKKQQILIKSLSDACRDFVSNELKTRLENVFSHSLNKSSANWQIKLDPDDIDGQSLLFYYPTLNSKQNNAYIRKAVKIELGCRGGREPIAISTITPFIEEIIPNTLSEPSVKIKTLAAERTFWEKATILHMYSHWPEDKKIPERQSRHFFDFYKLLKSSVKNSAGSDIELLQLVAIHKKIYFRSGWVKYEDVIKGKIQLIPRNDILKLLKNDYERMQDMFYGEYIAWDNIIDEIDIFQREFNVNK